MPQLNGTSQTTASTHGQAVNNDNDAASDNDTITLVDHSFIHSLNGDYPTSPSFYEAFKSTNIPDWTLQQPHILLGSWVIQ